MGLVKKQLTPNEADNLYYRKDFISENYYTKDNIDNTVTLNISLQNGFTPKQPNPLQIRKRSGVVSIFGDTDGGSLERFITIGKVPAGFEPTTDTTIMCTYNADDSKYYPYPVTVKTTGDIVSLVQRTGSSVATTVRYSGTWIIK